jgi:Flp pilus assembly protein TadG
MKSAPEFAFGAPCSTHCQVRRPPRPNRYSGSAPGSTMIRSRKPRPRSTARRAGAAIVELAVLLPFLLYFMVIAVDWARLMYYTIVITDCARSGAMYASDGVVRDQSPYTSVSQAALAEAPNLNPTPTVPPPVYSTSNGVSWVAVSVRTDFRTLTNFPGVPGNQSVTRTCKMQIAPLASR